MNIEIDAFTLTIDEHSGRVTGIKGKQDFLASDAALPLFALRFRDLNGEIILVDSDQMAVSVGETTRNSICLDFHGSDGCEVSASVHISGVPNQAEIQFRIKVQHSYPGYLEYIDFPGIAVPGQLTGEGGDGALLWPTTEGVLIEDLGQREETWLAYEPVEYPNHGWCGYYPGNAQMQFFAYSRKDEVLYFAAHDSQHSTKEIEFVRHGNGIRLIMRTYVGAIAAGSYELPFPMILGLFPGNWEDAAIRYRRWVESGGVSLPPKLKARKNGWLEDSPIVVTYPVTGEGHHAGPTMPNEFFPFSRALPVIENLGRELDSRLLTLLMHWEGTAPWSPPYVWPPRGGEEEMKSFASGLHGQGHLLGLYCSGIAWTNRSNTGDGGYNRLSDLENCDLKRFMCRGPKGEYECKICNGEEIRFGYDICASTEFARDVMAAEAVKIASADVDYIQLFDQNLGAASYQCYDAAHGHSGAPGKWQAEAMQSLIGHVQDELVKAGRPDVLLGCEAAAAECYIKQLPLNDLRFHMGFAYGRPVPAFALVFHQYTTNFMGNQVELLELVDHVKSPQNLFFRLAYSFTAGDLLTIVLKSGGEIHWAWCARWGIDAPEQEPLLEFIKHLNAWRKGIGKDFLFFGKMMKAVPFSGARLLPLYLTAKISERTLQCPAVLASHWIDAIGRDVQFLVNYSDECQSVVLESDSAFKVFRDPLSERFEPGNRNEPILLKARKAVMVEFANA